MVQHFQELEVVVVLFLGVVGIKVAVVFGACLVPVCAALVTAHFLRKRDLRRRGEQTSL